LSSFLENAMPGWERVAEYGRVAVRFGRASRRKRGQPAYAGRRRGGFIGFFNLIVFARRQRLYIDSIWLIFRLF